MTTDDDEKREKYNQYMRDYRAKRKAQVPEGSTANFEMRKARALRKQTKEYWKQHPEEKLKAEREHERVRKQRYRAELKAKKQAASEKRSGAKKNVTKRKGRVKKQTTTTTPAKTYNTRTKKTTTELVAQAVDTTQTPAARATRTPTVAANTPADDDDEETGFEKLEVLVRNSKIVGFHESFSWLLN